MILDKGLGLNAIEDLMATAADYIDFLKLSFGTSALFDENLLRQKIELVKAAGVDIYPGGTFLEVFVAQDGYDRYLERTKELGFTAVEVSDGVVKMSDQMRQDIIKKALDAGFQVISEVGKKDPAEAIPIGRMHDLIQSDIESGVFKVIVEAREAGRGVGIYDSSGMVKVSEVDAIISGVDDPNDLIWEAPIKSQQLYLILRFGLNVNLGNVAFDDVLALEALRCGLRGDTLKKAIQE
jgi:phosphosulfolactate synthase